MHCVPAVCQVPRWTWDTVPLWGIESGRRDGHVSRQLFHCVLSAVMVENRMLWQHFGGACKAWALGVREVF